MKKRTMAMVLVLVILAGLFGLAAHPGPSGESASSDETTRNDTLSLTQEDHLKTAQGAFSKAATDEDKIKATCEAFLTLGKASVRNPKAYDCTALVDSDNLGKNTIQYRLSEFQYLTALYEVLGWEILWDDLEFSDFEASIESDRATASVVESYSYYLNNDFDKVSFRRRMFKFDLFRGPDGWEITDISTNSGRESEDGFQYIPIDVKGTIDALLSEKEQARSAPPVSDDPADINAGSQSAAPRTEYPYFWTYDAHAAVDYAEDHYEDTANSVFGYNPVNNCQNFASQCVWAGLGGTGDDSTVLPAVSTTEVDGGRQAFNIWCQGEDSEYYDDYNFNWAWDNVRGFFNLMANSRTDAEGPYGNSSYSSAVALAQIGNVLALDKKGAPTSAATLDHAMFVTAVTGTAGQRTKDNVMVAAHTNQTDTAYQTLAEYIDTANRPIGNFARAYIYGGYYPSPQ